MCHRDMSSWLDPVLLPVDRLSAAARRVWAKHDRKTDSWLPLWRHMADSGAVAGLLARGAEPAQATVWSKHVHAAAGDVLAARWGRVGFLATEMLPELPLVLRSLGGD